MLFDALYGQYHPSKAISTTILGIKIAQTPQFVKDNIIKTKITYLDKIFVSLHSNLI